MGMTVRQDHALFYAGSLALISDNCERKKLGVTLCDCIASINTPLWDSRARDKHVACTCRVFPDWKGGPSGQASPSLTSVETKGRNLIKLVVMACRVACARLSPMSAA